MNYCTPWVYFAGWHDESYMRKVYNYAKLPKYHNYTLGVERYLERWLNRQEVGVAPFGVDVRQNGQITHVSGPAEIEWTLTREERDLVATLVRANPAKIKQCPMHAVAFSRAIFGVMPRLSFYAPIAPEYIENFLTDAALNRYYDDGVSPTEHARRRIENHLRLRKHRRRLVTARESLHHTGLVPNVVNEIVKKIDRPRRHR